MTIETLLDRMFPGTKDGIFPVFSDLDLDLSSLFVDDALEQIATLLNTQPQDVLNADDVNTLLKALRRDIPDTIHDFTLKTLEAYFSAPIIVRAVREGPEVLFPHSRALEDIDYCLLEPVMEKTEEIH